jgi:hypothetical protein
MLRSVASAAMVCDQHGPSATLISFAKDYEDERALFAIGLRISEGGNVLGRLFFCDGMGTWNSFLVLGRFYLLPGTGKQAAMDG